MAPMIYQLARSAVGEFGEDQPSHPVPAGKCFAFACSVYEPRWAWLVSETWRSRSVGCGTPGSCWQRYALVVECQRNLCSMRSGRSSSKLASKLKISEQITGGVFCRRVSDVGALPWWWQEYTGIHGGILRVVQTSGILFCKKGSSWPGW